MKNELTYTESYNELRKIVEDLEQGEVSIDDLSIKVKRASELIKICKSRLSATELDVNKILKDLEE